ncbi:hypothetical protein BDZ89DRAFT_1158536 [Hymenopellis radicata]|nr:hypothetical protein BDZ89DRAFT_1158536 [Hymenopellis radicata]
MFFTLARIPWNGYGPLQFGSRTGEYIHSYDHGLTRNWVGTMTLTGMAGTYGQNGEFQAWWWIWPKDGA